MTVEPISSRTAPRRRQRQVVINRAPGTSEVQRRLEQARQQIVAGVVDPAEFALELGFEYDRRRRGGRNCAVASITLFEVPALQERVGPGLVFDLVSDVTKILQRHLGPNDIVHISEEGEITVLARESRIDAAIDRIDEVSRAITGRYFVVNGERVLLTPSAGVATLDDGVDAADVVRRAVDAREMAAGHLDLRIHRWEPAFSADTAPPPGQRGSWLVWKDAKEKLRTPSQILATYVLGLFVPFWIYWTFDQYLHFDITWSLYLFVVFTLVLTGVMILVEARMAIDQREPPEVDEYPLATAIICAYLPNEAATIMGTLDAFMNQGYPGGLQIILAYNTPKPMPVEKELHALADRTPDLEVVRVEGSTSKAQNVNAVLHMARGEITGMFDADHEPKPGSFARAWRWLTDGYDVVQGHCLTRNGDESWLAKMIAVEFESIYAVAHPGRAKLHRFGVFGGSNGYWRTSLLHETRMRGSMLTEDIDSSMRTVERGLKIRSDRDIVSRELGTTTFKQVWNQRMRWAQGWFQVTLRHAWRVWRSPGLTLRQKCGATYLLGWREIYPWLSLQIFPLVAYWTFRGDPLSYGWPIFVFTTVFVLHIGPAQTWFAYKLADPEIKQHKTWFWAYLLFATVFYTEYKNTIARVSHIKEWVGERSWKVTPRSDAPGDAPTFDPEAIEDETESAEASADENVEADGIRATDVVAPPIADENVEADGIRATDVVAPPIADRTAALDRELVELLATATDPAPREAGGSPDETGATRRGTRHEPTPERVLHRRAESERLHDVIAGLVPTHGLAGEPLLPRRVPGDAVRSSFRHDEELLARRVRSLVERRPPPVPPVGEPLLTPVIPRRPRSSVSMLRVDAND
jgi:cellulose synthase/poly-beta-1,6-N-acetylglucosamine synthase-like glycosyltransferase/GGDEF domain-containing protein